VLRGQSSGHVQRFPDWAARSPPTATVSTATVAETIPLQHRKSHLRPGLDSLIA